MITITVLVIGIFIAVTALSFLVFQYSVTRFGGVQLNTISIKPQGDRSIYIGGLVGLIASLSMFWGSDKILLIMLLFTTIGAGTVHFGHELQKQQLLHKKKREVSVLFENIEILMRAGLPLQKALL